MYVWEYVVKHRSEKNPERFVEVDKKLRANEIVVENDMQIVYHLVAAEPEEGADAPAETVEAE